VNWISDEQKTAQQWLVAAVAGDFDSAWAASDLLRQMRIDYSRRERWCRPLWDGSSIDDRDVLIRCWRGLGDAIQFLRYAPLVRLRASSLTVEAPQALLPLFQTISGIDRLIELDHSETETKDYVEIESTELPYVFRTTLSTIPCTIPYLDTPLDFSQVREKQLTVGLCWCGGSYDLRRSIRLAHLEPLSGSSKLSFFQLQRGVALQEIARSPIVFRNPEERSMDLCMTASLIKTLDIIVTVDTMTAHLAGALGKKVFLLLHADADWRWLRDREDSPWYPSIRLLRQSQAGDWKPVVARLVELLTALEKP
jgi:hypothetical protein